MLLGFGESPDTVLDDDHGTIDDQAEVECAERHQIGANLVFDHSRHGGEHR